MNNNQAEERRDALRAEVAAMRQELREHIAEEMPALQALIQELGSPEQVRERRIFIEILIDRERDHRKLRTAVIEKGLLLALVAVLVFVGQAIVHELTLALKVMLGKA